MSEPEKCLSVGKSFSRREWLRTILILLMMQAGALTASHVFMSSQDVINYISFASTIASLLLAVLAIVYGFYQSESQKRTGDGIELHLSHLRTATDQIRSVSTSLAANSSDAAELSSSLKNLNEALQATHSKLNSVEGSVNDVVRQQESFGASLNAMRGDSASVSVPSSELVNDSAIDVAAKVVLGPKAGVHIKFVAIAILFAFEDREDVEIPIEKIGPAIVDVFFEENLLNWSSEVWVTAVIVAFSVLRTVGLIDYVLDEGEVIKSLKFNAEKRKIIDEVAEKTWKNSKRVALLGKLKKSMNELPVEVAPA